MGLYEMGQVCLGYNPNYSADVVCSYDEFCDLLRDIGYDGSIMPMSAAQAALILRLLAEAAPVLYRWEIVSLWSGVKGFRPQ